MKEGMKGREGQQNPNNNNKTENGFYYWSRTVCRFVCGRVRVIKGSQLKNLTTILTDGFPVT